MSDFLINAVNVKVLGSAVVNRCPHQMEIQSIVLAEIDGKEFAKH